MNWQDELRRIDSDLADGKLSKEQYASQREELLARASSAPDAPIELDPVDDKTPATQLLHTDRTTTAPSPADERSTDSMPHPPRTTTAPRPEPVDYAELPPPVPRQAPRPPTPPAPTPERAVPRGAGVTAAFLVFGVIVAVVLVGGGLWWLASGNDEAVRAGGNPSSFVPSGSTSTPPSSTTPPSTTPPDDELAALPDLPGEPHSQSGTHPVAKVETLYAPSMAKVLHKHGVREVQWKASMRETEQGKLTYVLLVADVGDETKAAELTRALQELGRKHAEPATWSAPGHDLPTFQRVTDGTALHFVAYQSGEQAVHVNLVEEPPQSRDATHDTLMNLVTDVMSTLVPS